MEKKELERIQDALSEVVGNYARINHTWLSEPDTGEIPTYKEVEESYLKIETFLFQELEKAREEGLEEGWKSSIELQILRQRETDPYFDSEDIDELNRLEKIEESIEY